MQSVCAETGSDIIFNVKQNVIPEKLLCNLKTTLPRGYKTKVIKCEKYSSSTYELDMRMNIRNEEDALKWLRCYEENSLTSWRSYHTYPNTKSLFKKKFRCHRNTKPKPNSTATEKHTNCPAVLSIDVKHHFQKLNKDVELKERPCEVSLRLPHNHSLTSCASLKYRKPTEEVVNKFKFLLSKGHSPSSAWQSYNFDLQVELGDQYCEVVGDRSICPSKSWVYQLYYKEFGTSKAAKYYKEFGTSKADELDNINEASATSTLEEENLELEKSINNIKDRLQAMVSDLEQCLQSNPTKYIPALNHFLQRFEHCKSDTEMLSWLHIFGVPTTNEEKDIQGENMIPVQPTVARRKDHLAGRNRQQTVRPRKRVLTLELNYALPAGDMGVFLENFTGLDQ